jgi:hypothetical protein
VRRLANGPPALSTRISVANACASLIGKIGALFAEKSRRVVVGPTRPGGTSTANESARTSRTASDRTRPEAFAKRTVAG